MSRSRPGFARDSSGNGGSQAGASGSSPPVTTGGSSIGAPGAVNHSRAGSAVAVGCGGVAVGSGVTTTAVDLGAAEVTTAWAGSSDGPSWARMNDPLTTATTMAATRNGARPPPGATGTGAKLDPSGARPGRSRSDIGTPYNRGPYHGDMDLGLTGARALVGGGSRGLGGAIAEALAGEGARVAVTSRPSAGLEAQAARLGGVAVGRRPLDAPTDPPARSPTAVDALGGLDLLVVNSGGPPPGRFEDLDDATWLRAIDGTLLSALRLLRAALPHLRDGRDPAILIILSSSVREPIPGLSTSNLMRPGLAGLLKSLVEEVAPIRINGLAPGRVATDRIGQLDTARAAAAGVEVDEIRRRTVERIPLGRYGDPVELGRVGAFLLSPAASYVTGAIVPVDGGMIKALP